MTDPLDHAARVADFMRENHRLGAAIRNRSSLNPWKRWRARRYLKHVPEIRIQMYATGPHLHFEPRPQEKP